jgi:peptidoglycan-N-acetylglucosamine deacetylase
VFWLIAAAIGVLAHIVPFPFLFDVTDRTIWQMPETDPPTVYLTFDDGPNPTATPALLDALRQHDARATFFVIDKHLTEATAPIVRRAFDEGHAVALHSDSRQWVFQSPAAVAEALDTAAARMEQLTGHRPCAAFRPHAGTRSVSMIAGAAKAGYRVVGWGFRLWDFNWFKRRSAEDMVPRLLRETSAGDIIVMHDGHHEDPRADRRYAVETVEQLVPELRARGFAFGTICPRPEVDASVAAGASARVKQTSRELRRAGAASDWSLAPTATAS